MAASSNRVLEKQKVRGGWHKLLKSLPAASQPEPDPEGSTWGIHPAKT